VQEEQIDSMSDESFPASDPPSFTPVAHVGGTPPEGSGDLPYVDEADRGWMTKAIVAAAALLAIGIAIAAASGMRKKKSRRARMTSRLHDDADQVTASAAALIAPVAAAARDRVQGGQHAAADSISSLRDRLAA
jgi:hypothetical protein